MASDKELTFKEVSDHNTKNDLYVVIHDKIYDASSFVDEHPYVPPVKPSVFIARPLAYLSAAAFAPLPCHQIEANLESVRPV